MLGALVLLAAVATALLVSASFRLRSLVSTLLVAYVALVADAVLVILALSPSREVTRAGVGGAQALVLGGAFALWLARGRPQPSFAGARSALRGLAGEPPAALFLVAVAALLGYELALAVTVPPNNWDSLEYHLARTAAWLQHGGYHWIANAPSNILNTRQPVAEQAILFVFAATGKAGLFALPQFLAGLAILVSVYGSARRLGFGAAPAVGAACLLATFSLFELEATTAQDDLVAASFPAVAACLLLGDGRAAELALAGLAVGVGVGVKLTSVLVWPVLALLALRHGRRGVSVVVAGALAGFAAVGMWGYVLNLVHTGRVLGQGRFSLDISASPSYPGSVLTGLYLAYIAMDISVLSHRLINGLAVIGCVAGVAVAVTCAFRRRRLARALVGGVGVALPFLAPVLTIAAAGGLAFLARRWGYPVRGPGGVLGPINQTANEDDSAFGPIGTVVLVVVPVLTVAAFLVRRADSRRLALALALPSFVVLLALSASFNVFLTRFLLVPAALAAPLLAGLFRSRSAAVAYLVAGSLVGALTITGDVKKPLSGPYGRPWQLTPAEALAQSQNPHLAQAVAEYDRVVPPHACVGAILAPDEPSYPLYGPSLGHRVVYVSVDGTPVLTALRRGLFYVVVGATGPDSYAAAEFRRAGWRVRLLGGVWLLASERHATTGTCNP